MKNILYYGDGEDSQRVIDAVKSTTDDVGYRFKPKSRRDDNRAVWGVRVDSSVDETAVTEALTDEFGDIELASVETVDQD